MFVFQSSFELTGYITEMIYLIPGYVCREFQSSFELTGYITKYYDVRKIYSNWVSKLFRAYGLYNKTLNEEYGCYLVCFKALSSLRVI